MSKKQNLFVFTVSCLVFLTFHTDNSPAGSKKPFTIILLPDTQKYKHEDRGSRSHIFESQTKWIVDHVIDKNIVLVLHLGDIVDYSDAVQWHFASKSLNILNGIVPYVLAVGNHDVVNGFDDTNKNTRLFNEHFKETDSKIAEKILLNFNSEVKKFQQVCPKEMLDKLLNPLTLKPKTLKAV